MSDKVYRTIIGIVQFDPREGEAGGKKVRNISVGQAGFANQAVRVSATLWPSHDAFKVERGDCVVLEGTYSQGTGEKDGAEVKYHNLSVTRAINLGAVLEGKKVDTVNDGADDAPAEDDDIPF